MNTTLQCINEIGIPLTPEDIESVYRIGKFSAKRTRPRPVKLTFTDRTKRDQVFIFKARLRFSEEFRNVRINKEERKDLRIKAAKLRQAGESAKNMGYNVESRQDHIRIDGTKYNIHSLDNVPDIFMKEPNEVRPSPLPPTPVD